MRKGFIFNQNKCVSCGACCAACILENRWTVKPRNIYKFNQIPSPDVSIVNISLACNHCGKPQCLSGCPTGAYFRDSDSQAVLINSENCLGCNYCKWNCPYDAPKSEPSSHLIEKCNLCYSLVKEDLNPACASACPTGALNFGPLSEVPDNNRINWFPDKKLNPLIEFPAETSAPPEIIPDQLFDNEPYNKITDKDIFGESSLIAFSFMITLSAAIMVSGSIKGVIPDVRIILPLIISAGFFSLFHLENKFRVWRVLTNLKSSPLSREIAAYIVYLLFSTVALLTGNSVLIIAASAMGLLLLILIDSVYTYSDNRKKVVLHSGQSFLTGLLIASFLSEQIYPFLLIAAIKLISGIYNIVQNKRSSPLSGLKFLRFVLLFTTGICLATGYLFPDPVISFLFLSGELIDRILFYADFDPINIKSITSAQNNYNLNEEKND